MPLPKRCCSNYCDHCCRCREFLVCTLFHPTSRIGTGSWGPSQCSPFHLPRSRPKRRSCLPFSPSPSLLLAGKEQRVHWLSAGKAQRGSRGAGAGCGAAMSALDPRGQQNTAGEAGSARGGRGLVTKGTPTRGSSQAGGSETPAWNAQKMLRNRSSTLPVEGKKDPSLGTRARPRLAQDLETSGHGKGAVP